jgi:hypothetical protein
MLEVCMGTGSLGTVSEELSKCKLDLVGVQEVRWGKKEREMRIMN